LTPKTVPCYPAGRGVPTARRPRGMTKLTGSAPMPVCIAGMHRSGTSMVARLLNLCGLNLGPRVDLLRPRPSNPEGFWENRHFVRLNDALLRQLGGMWDRPPCPAAGWEDRPDLAPLRRQAGKFVRRFGGRRPWGWKDPRNCLTLPFWQGLVPVLRVLVCVRNPLAVARSLRGRDGRPQEESFRLWLTYTRRVLAAVPFDDLVLTHYDRYFTDPCGELRRVLGLLGLGAGDGEVSRACASIAPSLAHHRVTVEDLIRAGGPGELVKCYLALCQGEGAAAAGRRRAPRPGEIAPRPAR
jgi:hypothetical protein